MEFAACTFGKGTEAERYERYAPIQMMDVFFR